MQGHTHAHQYDFDHLLELAAGHLNIVEEALWFRNFIPHNRVSSYRMPFLIALLRPAYDSIIALGYILAILELGHQLINLILHLAVCTL